MGSVIDCPRCHKTVVVPPQSVPQAEQLYQMLKNKRSAEAAAPPPPNNIVQEPNAPESAWDELGGNVNDADLNQWIDELWNATPANMQDSLSMLLPIPLPIPNALSDMEVDLLALQKRYRLAVTLLYVSSAVALFVGFLLGILFHVFIVPSNFSDQNHLAGNGNEVNAVSGTLFFHNENGDRLSDVDAVIMCLPIDRWGQLSCQGLRPGDAANNDAEQLIQEMGGMFARADINGSFTLPYRAGIRYFVILVSAHQKRSGEIKPSVRRELDRYFRDSEQFGENCLFTDEYEWSGGKFLFRHTFAIGD